MAATKTKTATTTAASTTKKASDHPTVSLFLLY